MSIATVLVALLAGATTAEAQTLNVCAAKKKDCVAQKVKALLKCHAKAEKKGLPVDVLCVQKADDKFDGGAVPAKGCFAKLEAKGGCLTTGDTGVVEAAIDAFVLDAVADVDPGYPVPIQNLCSAKKKGCIAKKVKAVLKCYSKAEKKGVVVDPLCLDKAGDKFDGGADPARGCFAKLEAKGGCLTTGDTTSLADKIDAFAADTVCALDPAAPDCGGCGPSGPSTFTFTANGADSDQDFSVFGYDSHLPSMSRMTLALDSCANDAPPCGICTVSGPIANPGGAAFANRRCRGADGTGANGSWISCTSDAACAGSGNACVYFFGSPQPIGVGGIGVCATNEIAGPVTGTVNVETGSAALLVPWRLRMAIGSGGVGNPCPRCIAGTCSGGPRNGQACTVNGSSTLFGDDLSLDCPPGVHSAESIATVPLTTGVQTLTLGAGSPACLQTGYTGLKCPCDTCDNAAATPCTSHADCLAVGATTCGGKRCLVPAPNPGQPCTAHSQCSPGFCGVPGEPTRPNVCDPGSVCTANTPPDNDSIDEGVCSVGPAWGTCASESYRSCLVDSDCPLGGDSCVYAESECFTIEGAPGDSVSVGGVASPSAPTLGALVCLPPTGASLFNTALGLPGLSRMTIPGTASFN